MSVVLLEKSFVLANLKKESLNRFYQKRNISWALGARINAIATLNESIPTLVKYYTDMSVYSSHGSGSDGALFEVFGGL